MDTSIGLLLDRVPCLLWGKHAQLGYSTELRFSILEMTATGLLK